MTKTKRATKPTATTSRSGAKEKPTKAKTAATAAPKSRKPGKGGKATSEASAAPTTDSGRHRWKEMTLEQLQTLYAEKVGRTTESEDRGYLTWKIREAEAGRIPVGPRTDTIEGPKTAVTILFGEDVLASIDAAAKEDGFPKRLRYLRDLLRRGLEIRGRAELAAQIPG